MAFGSKQRADEPAELGGRCEQARMAGNAAEPPGVAVVHLAPDEARLEPLVAVELGRRDQRPLARHRSEAGALQPERHGDGFGERPVDRGAGAVGDRPAEQHVPEIAVDDRARDGGRRLGVDGLADRRRATLQAIELAVSWQSRGVREQLAEGDLGIRETGQPGCGRVIQGPGAALGQAEAQRHGRDHLRQRREVVDRVAARRDSLVDDARPAAVGVQKLARRVDHEEVGASREPAGDRLAEQAGEAFARPPERARRALGDLAPDGDARSPAPRGTSFAARVPARTRSRGSRSLAIRARSGGRRRGRSLPRRRNGGPARWPRRPTESRSGGQPPRASTPRVRAAACPCPGPRRGDGRRASGHSRAPSPPGPRRSGRTPRSSRRAPRPRPWCPARSSRRRTTPLSYRGRASRGSRRRRLLDRRPARQR